MRDNWARFQICMLANSIPTERQPKVHDKSEQGYIQAHQHPGSTNDNIERDREPESDCGFHLPAV